MFTFFPIYKFNIVTNYSPKIVKSKLSSLLKKEVKSKKKFEFYIQGHDMGIEEFSGKVEEEYFRLKRYKYFSNDLKLIIYKGKIKPTEGGSIINITFQYDLFTIIFLSLIFFTFVFNFIVCIIESDAAGLENSVPGVILSIFIYLLFMVAFNYRATKVRMLLETLLKAK